MRRHAAPGRPAGRTPGLRGMLATFFAAITAVPLVIGLFLMSAQVDDHVAQREAAELTAAAQRVADAATERDARVGDLTTDLADLLVADGQAEALAERDGAALEAWLSDRATGRVPERADLVAAIDADRTMLASAGDLDGLTAGELGAAADEGRTIDGTLVSRREIRAEVDGRESTIGWIAAASRLGPGRLAETATVELAVLGDEVAASSQPVPEVRPRAGETAAGQAGDERVVATTVPSPAGRLLVWRPAGGGLELGGLLTAVALPALVLAALLGWILARRVAEPMTRAAQTARAVADGDLARQVPSEEGPAEVRDLAEALNRMSHELSQRLRELEVSRDALGASLERVGRSLASSLDLDGVLAVIAEAAADALDADGALVILRDERDRLTVRARHGASGPAPGHPAPALGQGIVGSVADRGEPVRVPPAELEPAPLDASSPCQLAVPLAVRGQAEGVLTLLRDDAARPFGERQQGLLGSFAAQASVALENVHRHAEAREQAATDGLTGLANVRTLHEALRREVDAADRYERPLSALAIDLDRFKAINDRWGHQVGDRVLAEVAARLGRLSRAADLAARAGGEEFVVLLPETELSGAAALAERVREAVASEPIVTTGGVRLERVTCSIGVAQRAAGEEGAGMLRRADAALYAAKDGGRNRVALAEAPVGKPHSVDSSD